MNNREDKNETSENEVNNNNKVVRILAVGDVMNSLDPQTQSNIFSPYLQDDNETVGNYDINDTEVQIKVHKGNDHSAVTRFSGVGQRRWLQIRSSSIVLICITPEQYNSEEAIEKKVQQQSVKIDKETYGEQTKTKVLVYITDNDKNDSRDNYSILTRVAKKYKMKLFPMDTANAKHINELLITSYKLQQNRLNSKQSMYDNNSLNKSLSGRHIDDETINKSIGLVDQRKQSSRTSNNVRSTSNIIPNDSNKTENKSQLNHNNSSTTSSIFSVPTNEPFFKYTQVLESDYDFQFKIGVLGPGGVGKTSAIKRFCFNTFNAQYDGDSKQFEHKTINIDNKNINVRIEDNHANQRFRKIINNDTIYKSHAIIIFFDLTSTDGLNKAKSQVVGARDMGHDNVIIILAGTKSDLENSREINHNDVQRYADSQEIPYIEISAKNNCNVKQLFETACNEILKQVAQRYINNNKFLSNNNT